MKRTCINLLAISIVICCAVAEAQTTRAVTAPDAKVEKIAGEFKFTEGPTSDKDGNVYFVDQNNDRIMKWDVSQNQLSTFMQPSGYSNGMTFDNKGMLIACADEKNELWSIDVKTKEHKVILKDLDGKFFNGPNDVWCHPITGRLYITDPYYHRPWWKRGDRDASELPQCVYFLEPDRGKATRVIDDFQQPNGIIGTPDGKQLYVSDIRGRKTYVYNIQPDGMLTNKKEFCAAGSDGMTIDSEGNVYLSTAGRPAGVSVYDKAGQMIQKIETPEAPANMCFGGKDMKTLFITARTGFYAIRMAVMGVGPQ